MARTTGRSGFKMKSGNTTPFKSMGSSPVKQSVFSEAEVVEPTHISGHRDITRQQLSSRGISAWEYDKKKREKLIKEDRFASGNKPKGARTSLKETLSDISYLLSSKKKRAIMLKEGYKTPRNRNLDKYGSSSSPDVEAGELKPGDYWYDNPIYTDYKYGEFKKIKDR